MLSIQIDSGEERSVSYTDVRMEQSYLDMRKRNRNYQENKMLSTNENESVHLETASLTACFNNDRGQYISLENMISSDNPFLIPESECHDPLLDAPIERLEGSKGNLLSSGNAGTKRFSSYPRLDPAHLLHPPQVITPAKSYPNPMYMMTFPALNTNESPNIESIKNDLRNRYSTS